MALTPEQLAAMDKITGRSSLDMDEMDRITGLGDKKEVASKKQVGYVSTPFNTPFQPQLPKSKSEKKRIQRTHQKALQNLQEYEKEHPFISEIRKSLDPTYRPLRKYVEDTAKYGGEDISYGQMLDNLSNQVVQTSVAPINIGTGIATAGLGTAKGLLPTVLTAARQGAIQGGVEGLTGGIADEGLSVNALKRGGLGTATGAAFGAGIQAIPYAGSGLIRPIIDNPQVQNAMTSGLELLTSVPKKYSDLALKAELAGKSILGGKFNPETAYQGVERKLRTAKGMLPTDKQYKEQYKQLGNQVREKLNKAIKPNEYFDEMFNKLGVQSGEYVQSLRKAKGEAVGKAEKGLKENLDRFDYQDLINDVEQTFKAYQRDLINPAEYDTGGLKQELIDLIKGVTRFNKRVIDPTKPATAFDNLYSHFLDYIEQNKTNPNVVNNAQAALSQITKNLNPEMQNYYSNALNQDLDTIINYGKVTPESFEGVVDLIGKRANFKDNKYASPYEEYILQQLYGKFSNRLKNISPDLEKSKKEFSDLMSKLNELGIDKEKIPSKKMAEIIKNYVYGNGKQVRSGQDVVLEDLLSPDLMKSVNELGNAYTTQQQLQKNIGEGILNDISKYQNAPYATQEALERVAPEQVEQFANLLDQQTTQKNILEPISAKAFERNPKLLSSRNDVATEEALAYLQERSGINFMDELEETRAREALEAISPGQGGGSGGGQGFFNNVVRPQLINLGKLTSGALIGSSLGGPLGATMGLLAVSPKITAKGTIQNLGRLYRGLENPNVNRLRQIAVPLSVPTLQGGIVYNEDRY